MVNTLPSKRLINNWSKLVHNWSHPESPSLVTIEGHVTRSLYESWVQAWSPQKATSRAAHIRRIARINGLDRENNVDFAKEPLGFTEIPPVVLLCVRRLTAPRRWLLWVRTSLVLPPATPHTARRRGPAVLQLPPRHPPHGLLASLTLTTPAQPPFPWSKSSTRPGTRCPLYGSHLLALMRPPAPGSGARSSPSFTWLFDTTTPSPAAATGVARAVCLCVTIGATQERWAALTPWSPRRWAPTGGREVLRWAWRQRQPCAATWSTSTSHQIPACMVAGSHLLLPPAPPDTARMKGSRWPTAHHSRLPSSTGKGSPALKKHQWAPGAARRRLVRFSGAQSSWRLGVGTEQEEEGVRRPGTERAAAVTVPMSCSTKCLAHGKLHTVLRLSYHPPFQQTLMYHLHISIQIWPPQC
jgi:hypothetical protein